MPSPVAHGIIGAASVLLIHPRIPKVLSFPVIASAFLGNAADLDFILSFLTNDKSWHRGFTHSILFSLIVFSAFWVVLRRRDLRESLAFGAAYFTHIVLDFMTSDHGGPELFWFFSDVRLSVGLKTFSVPLSLMGPMELLYVGLYETAIFGTAFLAAYAIRSRYLRNVREA